MLEGIRANRSGDELVNQDVIIQCKDDIELAAYPTKPAVEHGTDSMVTEIKKRAKIIEKHHEILIATRQCGLLIILQGMDAAGKDGTTKHIASNLNPIGTIINSFKVPNEDEREHDYLWRVHNRVPARGEVGIFNRSHYEDVLVPMVTNEITAKTCQKRYRQINDFEKMLVENDIIVIKLFLHISKSEQKTRLEKRLRKPQKQWKFSMADLEARKKWGDFSCIYEETLSKTSTSHAPWHIIPADDKLYRNYLVSRLLLEVFESLNLNYPDLDQTLKDIVIED